MDVSEPINGLIRANAQLARSLIARDFRSVCATNVT